MTTATVLPTDTRELHIELEKLEAVQKRIDTDTEKLQAANSERARLVAAVGYGTAKETEVRRVEDQIHEISIRLEASAPILSKHRARVEDLQKQIRERQVAAARAQHEREYADLSARARNRAALIRDVLTELCAEALLEFEQDRQRLALEFADVGGVDAAVAIGRELVNPAKGMEAARNPEVHLAALYARSFVPLGGPDMSHARGNWKPGLEPLQLTVRSMRPKTYAEANPQAVESR